MLTLMNLIFLGDQITLRTTGYFSYFFSTRKELGLRTILTKIFLSKITKRENVKHFSFI